MTDGNRDSGLGHRVPTPGSRIPALLVATALGAGYAPIAPGTFGSAVGLIVWMILPHTVLPQAVAILVLFAAGAWSGTIAEDHFGKRDPGQVVIDEVMGVLITLFLNPVGLAGAAVGFVLFRVADVIKPWPANRLEALPGGVGVMADDAMAAVYANLVLRAVLAVGRFVIG